MHHTPKPETGTRCREKRRGIFVFQSKVIGDRRELFFFLDNNNTTRGGTRPASSECHHRIESFLQSVQLDTKQNAVAAARCGPPRAASRPCLPGRPLLGALSLFLRGSLRHAGVCPVDGQALQRAAATPGEKETANYEPLLLISVYNRCAVILHPRPACWPLDPKAPCCPRHYKWAGSAALGGTEASGSQPSWAGHPSAAIWRPHRKACKCLKSAGGGKRLTNRGPAFNKTPRAHHSHRAAYWRENGPVSKSGARGQGRRGPFTR